MLPLSFHSPNQQGRDSLGDKGLSSQLGHSQLKRERGYQGWDTAEGTGLRRSGWKVPNGKNTWLNYIPHFMTKIICYSVIHCLRNFHGLGELSFKNVKSFLKQDVK